jgi:hypothetical protein
MTRLVSCDAVDRVWHKSTEEIVVPRLSSLVIGDVTDLEGGTVVRTRTAGGPVPFPVRGCPVQTFREQVPGVPDRCQRHTPCGRNQLSASPADSAAARDGYHAGLAAAAGPAISRTAAMNGASSKAP